MLSATRGRRDDRGKTGMARSLPLAATQEPELCSALTSSIVVQDKLTLQLKTSVPTTKYVYEVDVRRAKARSVVTLHNDEVW